MKFKNKILLVTAALFLSLITFFNIYIIYMKNNFIKNNMVSYNENFVKTYNVVQLNISNTLSKRIEVMVTKKNHKMIKDILLKQINYEEGYSYINGHFEKLQKELKYLATLHLYDANGISLIRAHEKNRYGDDLKQFRPSVRELVQNPKSTYFFESGLAGVFFRIVEPIYDGKQLLGFFEIGLKPRVFIERIHQFLDVDSFVFLDKELYKVIDKKFLSNDKEKIQFGKYIFFSRCEKDTTLIKKIPKTFHMQDDKKYNIDGKTVMIHTTAIDDYFGDKIGVFLSFQDFSYVENDYKYFFWASIIVSIFVLIIILGILDKSYLKLTKELDQYLYILDKVKNSIFIIDIKTHKVVFSNEQAQVSLDYTKKEMKSLNLEQISIPINLGDELVCQKNLEDIKKSNESFVTRAYSRKKNGTIVPVEINFSYVKHKEDEYLVAICHNIEEQLKFEQKDKANDAIINKYVPISQTDLDGNITYVNDAFCKLVKYEKEDLIGQNHRILKHPDTKDSLYTNLWAKLVDNRPWSGILRNVTKDNEVIWANVTIEPMYDHFNKKVGYISTREDISDKKELEYMSDHDLLTKAKNRRACEREIHKHIQNAHRYKDKEFGLIMLDIDHFKNINDTYGHHTGDMVLTNLSEVIHLIIREGDTFARWGGEEFIIICPHATKQGLEIFVQKIQNTIQQANFLPVLTVTASFGITLFEKDDTIETVQKRVDDALYLAKNNGRNRYEVL